MLGCCGVLYTLRVLYTPFILHQWRPVQPLGMGQHKAWPHVFFLTHAAAQLVFPRVYLIMGKIHTQISLNL